MPTIDDLTALVVNFRTLAHTRNCLETLRAAYPTLQVLVIDNGSADESAEYLASLAAADDRVRVLFNDENRFHGPALDQGMHAIDTPYVFLLDSDCIIEHGGFLEPLLDAFAADPFLYAIGKRGHTNRYGYAPVSEGQARTFYVHPFAGVFDRAKYFTLPPFVHHGAPLYRNMWGARRAGYHLEHVTIEDHVTHLGKVTARVHGYGLDRRLRMLHRLNVLETRVRSIAARAVGRRLQPPPLPPDRSEPPANVDEERPPEGVR